MRFELLYVSFGQRYGPEQVAMNLLNNILRTPDLDTHGIVEQLVAASLPKALQRKLNVVRDQFKGIRVLFIASLRHRPRIVHFNFPPLHPAFMPILLLLKIIKARIVYSFHGGILFEGKSSILTRLFLMSCKYVYDTIIVNSEYSARVLLQVQKGLERKVVVIPNGINMSDFDQSKRVILQGKPAILYVGRLVHVKGVDILIRAMPSIIERLPEVRLHLVGSGPQIYEIKELISHLDIERNVILHGFVPHKKIYGAYLGGDIVIIPSRSETFGITVLEAMAAGKPIIVSDRGALPELVRNFRNGLVVILDSVEIARAVFNLTVNKNLMAHMSKNNKIKARLYDWKRISERYIYLYKTVVRNEFH